MLVAKLIKLLMKEADTTRPIGIMVDGKFTEIVTFREEREGIVLLTEKYLYVRLLPGMSGRIAVFARMKSDHGWVQVESIMGDDAAEEYAYELEVDDAERGNCVEDNLGKDWGDDAPVRPPQK